MVAEDALLLVDALRTMDTLLLLFLLSRAGGRATSGSMLLPSVVDVEDVVLIVARGLIFLNEIASDSLLRVAIGSASDVSSSDEEASGSTAGEYVSMTSLPNLFNRGVLILEPSARSRPELVEGNGQLSGASFSSLGCVASRIVDLIAEIGCSKSDTLGWPLKPDSPSNSKLEGGNNELSMLMISLEDVLLVMGSDVCVRCWLRRRW